jgi:hypothetical protein
MAGDIVNDAPAGLVNMAVQGAKHAVTGELLAEIVSDSVGSVAVESDEVQEAISIIKEIRSSAVSLGIADAETLSITQLIDEVAKVSFGRLEKEKADNELLEKQKEVDAQMLTELTALKENAKELKIPGYTKMDAEELKVAISAHVGSEPGGK